MRGQARRCSAGCSRTAAGINNPRICAKALHKCQLSDAAAEFEPRNQQRHGLGFAAASWLLHMKSCRTLEREITTLTYVTAPIVLPCDLIDGTLSHGDNPHLA